MGAAPWLEEEEGLMETSSNSGKARALGSSLVMTSGKGWAPSSSPPFLLLPSPSPLFLCIAPCLFLYSEELNERERVEGLVVCVCVRECAGGWVRVEFV